MPKTNKRGDRKKLSWIYRTKNKFQKLKKVTENVNGNTQIPEDNNYPRIIVRNVSFKATEGDVKKLYEPFGDIVDINFPKRPDGTPVGCCFVHFKQMEDASKAIFNTNKKEFLGRVISSSWAVAKSKYCEKLRQESASTENIEETAVDSANKEKQDRNKHTEHTNEEKSDNKGKVFKQTEIKEEKDPSKEETWLQTKREKRKHAKESNRKRRARVVVRNLAFQATEENLKEHFAQYGTIEEVKILKRSDGMNVGCAFLQFEHVQSAAKAIHYANLQPLLDRPVIVDWAVPKNQFSNDNTKNTNIDETKIKIEKEDDTEDQSVANKTNELNASDGLGSEDEKPDIANGNNEPENDDIEEIELDPEDESGRSDKEVSEDDEEDAEEKVNAEKEKRPRYESHDVSEGKTVFLKNVPFSVKNEELKKRMEMFGPVYYALVCIDSLTEFSRGTAFVKFKNIEDAEKCLSAGSELQMDDQILEAHRALDRNEVENKANSKERKQRDSRNLYLVKEGVVLAGSTAAAGVSAADMAKRLQIEQWKSQILRNLNMFVSRTRLVVHNLPPTLDDVKLRKIIERYVPSTAVIREARVMRDLKNVDIKGVGKSKEYAFVSFTKHEDALQTLRTINNNPNIFNPKRRPIVSFSIENRVLVNAKQKRLQKSRESNPLWTGNEMKRKGGERNEEVPTKQLRTERTEDPNVKPYTGMVGKFGENKLRSKYNLKTQAMVHSQTVKKEKKVKKSNKKLEMKRKQKIANKKEAKPKQRRKVNPDDANLDKLVNKYKDKLKSVELKKSKWYES